MNKIPVLTSEYLLQSEWVTVLATTHLPLRTEYLITLRRRAAETYPICDDPLSTTRRRTFAPLLTDCAEITALLRYGV